MLTVLMIDDDEELAETVRDAALGKLPDIDFVIESDFSKAEVAVRRARPDIMILDMYRGVPTDKDVGGQAIWESLWFNRCCPVVVYTAGFDDLEPEVPKDHPFIRYLEKGVGSDETVVSYIRDFEPTASSLRAAETEVERAFQSVLQSVSEFAFAHAADPEVRSDVIVRAARRRVAALMDDSIDGNRGILGWEQYLLPPIGEGLLMGDVIQDTSKDNEDPTAYGVVLSPSCDIQPGRHKVENVLVARCSDCTNYVFRGVGVENEKKARKKLPISLNDAHASGFALLPSLPGRMPPLAINLRDLTLVPPDTIGQENDGKQYSRVVSVDSPFREQLAWAYLQIAGRPGLPDRDHSATVDELMAKLKSKDG